MHLLKLIIIDDERLIREGLRTYIDWAALNVEVAAVCQNGLEGVDLIARFQPDIVLTDISMPAMDGIELLKYLRERHIPCELIFISSYAEFRYAQDAVTYGAFDYILKPIEPDALFQCVRRCVQKIESDQKRLPGVAVDQDMIEEWLRNILISVPKAQAPLMELLKKQGRELGRLALITAIIAKPLTLPVGGAFYAARVSDRVSAVLGPGEEELKKLAELNKLSAYRIAMAGDDIGQRFSHSLFSLWWEGLPAGDRLKAGESDEALPSFSAVNALHQKDMLTALRRALQTFCAQQAFALLTVSNRVAGYVSELYHQLEAQFQSPLPGVSPLERCLDELHGCNNLYDLFLCAEEIATRLYTALSQSPAYTSHTRKAVQMVYAEYAGNLTLHEVAARLNVSPSYFSTLFKADTGYAFSDYLYRYRMNIARDLLKDSQAKIYEVADRVGYSDVVQFSKRFKQFYHISPRQMQQRLELEPHGDRPRRP